MIHRPDFSQLPLDKDVYFLASGGRDSSAMVLEAYNLGIEGTMLFNYTHYNNASIEILQKISDFTNYDLVSIKYDGKKAPGIILKESFLNIPKALERVKNNRFSWRNTFTCCNAFKKRPMNRYFKTLDSTRAILLIGIKGHDGSYIRRWRLSQLRKKEVFHRLHKKNGLLYYYPLRDCTDEDIKFVLADYGFEWIGSSGCSLCPVFCLFDGMRKNDPITWLRSVTYARKLGVDFPHANQTQLTQFCTGAG